MKTTAMRSVVLLLVVAGFSASTFASTAARNTPSKHLVRVGLINTPTPMCPLHDPKGCGID